MYPVSQSVVQIQLNNFHEYSIKSYQSEMLFKIVTIILFIDQDLIKLSFI